MTYQTIDLQLDERGVLSLTLNRPDKRNAMSAQMIDELTHVARHLPAGTRVVVLSGTGSVFCAGGDLGWMRDQMAADRGTRIAGARQLAQMLGALNILPVPLIGKLQGAAMGGGVGLACICDVAIAADDCTFGLTETRLGLIPATIGPYVLARLGEGHARRVFMSARLFKAPEAADLGIIARAVPLAALDAAIEAEVLPYLSAAPGAVAAAKALARTLGPPITPEDIEASVTALADIWEGAEAQEGVAAFFEKRAPDWQR